MDDPRWWRKGVLYEIYVRSFQDSNGDGIGDLPGITNRLDYCRWLGVNAVWLSPFFPSPMADFGYDVSNYTDVHPLFGTLEDFDALLATAHRHGLRVVIDYVPNHSSDQHPWFRESRSSRDNPYRDWYIWRDPAPDGGPPNNWRSVFGGSAWEFDEHTGQYYFHSYLTQQPELNWRNPEVERAMFDVLRFWLDRGVDGFRLDAISRLVKDDQFRDNPRNPDWQPGQNPYRELLQLHSADQPEVHDILARMRRLIDVYGDRVMIGEAYLPLERIIAYYGNGAGIHFPFNFQLINIPWDAARLRKTIDTYEAAIPRNEWPNWVLGNHDKPRVATRVGSRQARVAAMLLLTLRGTPTMYYGDELGLPSVDIPADLVQDPWEKNVPGLGLGRDPVRTPMQWSREPGAGFTTAEKPWLPFTADWKTRNVDAFRDDDTSILTLYRRMLQLRLGEPALSLGSYTSLDADPPILAYLRTDGDGQFVVALNLDGLQLDLPLPYFAHPSRVELSTHLDREDERVGESLHLRGHEGVILAIEK